jgi:PAS domain S-box-containing protein
MLEHSLAPTAVADLEGRLSYVNPAFLSTWGYAERAEVLGRFAHDAFWVDPDAALAALRGVVSDGVWQGELEARRTDGRTMLVAVSAHVLLDATAQPVAVMASFADRTAAREAARLAESERRFSEAVIGAAGVLLTVMDDQGRFLRFNREAESLSGWTADQILGRSPWDTVLPPDVSARVRAEAFEAAMATAQPGEVRHYRNEWLTRDGRRRLIDWTNTVLPRDDGHGHSMVSVGIDITEQQATQAALALSEARLNRAQTVAQVGSWDLDIASGKVSWSDEVFRIFEVDRSRFGASYESFLAAIHPDDREAVDRAFTASLASRQPYRIRHRLLMSDGRVKWVEERGESSYAADGSALRSTGTVQDVTEDQARERELERFRHMVEESSTEVWLVDRQWRIRYVNAAAARSVQRSVAQLQGMQMTEIDARDEASMAALQAEFARHWRAELPLAPFETVHRSADGREVPKIVYPTFLEYDGDICVCAFAQDIGARRAAEAALAASTRMLKDALDSFPGVVAGVDEAMRYVYVNQRFCTDGGVERDAVLGRTVAEVLGPAAAAALAPLHARVQAGERVSEEQRRGWPNGSERLYSVDYRRTDDPKRPGRHLMYAFARDITDIRRDQQRLQATIEGTRTGTWEWHAQNGRFEVNHWQAALVGATPADLTAQWRSQLAAMIHPEDREVRRAALRRHLAGETPYFEYEYRARHRDGHWVWVLERGQAVERDAEGRALVVLGTSQDISELKGKELELRHLTDELELRVEARTRELAAAKAQAEQASQAKTEFLSRMSHELRTPLNAILGFGQLLELAPLQREEADHVREVLRAGRHLLDLINEVLDLAAVEAGRLRLDLRPLAPLPLVDECLALIRPALQQAGLTLALDPGPPGLHVLADPGRLKQVLLNLLSNAVKYNRAGGQVSVHLRPAAGDTVEIAVADTGHGLTPAQQVRLFRPFERLEAHAGGIQGTGIGLSVSRGLVELMHGRIEVDSRPGTGSRFSVTLPAAAPPDPAAALAPAAEPVGPPAATPVRRRVLYVEDNAANLRLMQRMLQRRPGLSLASAGNVDEGVAAALALQPELLLLDLHLPDGDGQALLQRLRSAGLTAPAVAVSANALPTDIARARAAGFTDYLTKPLELARVLAVVDELLGAEPSA